jgi:hypothetical protein
MKDSIKPVLRAGRSKVAVSDQGYTYNEAGFTYNQAGWMYGGLYEHDIIPQFSRVHNDKLTNIIRNIAPTMTVGRTNVQIADQGYTYNQAGFTYNQALWQYGGLFENDIYPMITRARIEKPSVMIGGDFGAIHPVPCTLGQGMLVGMLGMTYSEDIPILVYP